MSRFLRAEMILPLTIVLAAVMLGVSEFMITFRFTPPGGEPLREQLASDRHSYALLLLSVFAVASMVVAIVSGARLAATATAVFGIAALLLFLVVDLPDAGKIGDLDDPVFGFANARADPQTGFWLEAVGSVVLGLATVAFATLGSQQLGAPLERYRSKRRRSEPAADQPALAGERPSPGRAEEPPDLDRGELEPRARRRSRAAGLRGPRGNDS